MSGWVLESGAGLNCYYLVSFYSGILGSSYPDPAVVTGAFPLGLFFLPEDAGSGLSEGGSACDFARFLLGPVLDTAASVDGGP